MNLYSKLLEREAAVEKSESRVAAYRENIDSVADDLKRRQDVIEELTETLDLPEKAPEKTKAMKDTVSDSSGEAAKTIGNSILHRLGLLRGLLRQIERLGEFLDHVLAALEIVGD